jgi:2-dehydro-3-deoxygalactonokinase
MEFFHLDSGTTNTRLRLMRDSQIVWTAALEVGARDVAAKGRASLLDAVATLLSQGESAAPAGTTVLASGMITSNLGLLEVPHLLAPAAPNDLAAGIVRHYFPELGRDIHFIPGVKTLPTELNAATLHEADVMRGEEVEAIGLRALLALEGPATLVHYGSHHKVIDCDAAGRVLGSRTSPTGEAYLALSQNTILRGSVVSLEEVRTIDYAAWREGLDASLRHGFGRALFMVRLSEQVAKQSRERATAFMLGVLSSLDLALLPPPDRDRTLLLYGRPLFAAPMVRYLSEEGRDARLVDEATAQLAAPTGAGLIYDLAAARA